MEYKLFRDAFLVGIGAIVLFGITNYSNGEEQSQEQRSTRAYIVKEGDTLWGISKRFYNSPYYWPRVWERNPYIKNPHWIYPGEPIYLYSEIAFAPAVPAPPQPEQEEVSRQLVDTPLTIPLPEEYNSGILTEEELKKAGGIVGAYDDKLLLTQGDVIYIHMKKDENPVVGQRYGIFRAGSVLQHPKTGATLGRMYKILGYGEILTTGDGEVVSARIVSSRDTMQIGDGVKMFEPAQKQVVLKSTARAVDGYIVASLEDHTQMAQHDIVFIDLGIQDGIEVGNELLVMEEGKIVSGYTGKEEVRLPDKKLATLVVVKTDRTASAALVTDSQRTFSLGALVKTNVDHLVQ